MGKDFSRRAREIDPQKKPARLHLRTWMQGIVDEEALSMPKATDFDRRFDSRRQELSQLYGELYQGDSAALGGSASAPCRTRTAAGRPIPAGTAAGTCWA